MSRKRNEGTLVNLNQRRDEGALDRIGGRAADYHARVAAAFLRYAAEDPARFAVIAAEGAPEAVHARVLAAIGAA